MTEDFNKWAKYVADIERLETENAELTTHINELEKERVQLDDVIKELSSKCGQLEYDRDALAVIKDELSSKTEQLDSECKSMACENDTLSMENTRLQNKLKIAMDALKDYKKENWAYEDEYNYYPLNEGGWYHAEEALKQIKEVK